MPTFTPPAATDNRSTKPITLSEGQPPCYCHLSLGHQFSILLPPLNLNPQGLGNVSDLDYGGPHLSCPVISRPPAFFRSDKLSVNKRMVVFLTQGPLAFERSVSLWTFSDVGGMTEEAKQGINFTSSSFARLRRRIQLRNEALRSEVLAIYSGRTIVRPENWDGGTVASISSTDLLDHEVRIRRSTLLRITFVTSSDHSHKPRSLSELIPSDESGRNFKLSDAHVEYSGDLGTRTSEIV
nr:hypothetical protein Iba_chr09eCG11990 [Ipomoea batatas]